MEHTTDKERGVQFQRERFTGEWTRYSSNQVERCLYISAWSAMSIHVTQVRSQIDICKMTVLNLNWINCPSHYFQFVGPVIALTRPHISLKAWHCIRAVIRLIIRMPNLLPDWFVLGARFGWMLGPWWRHSNNCCFFRPMTHSCQKPLPDYYRGFRSNPVMWKQVLRPSQVEPILPISRICKRRRAPETPGLLLKIISFLLRFGIWPATMKTWMMIYCNAAGRPFYVKNCQIM